MASEKTLACVGVNGFDRARLRLLLGEASAKLQVQWHLGSLEQADVLVTVPGSLEADAAAMRARGRGVHCVNLGAPGEVGDDFLPAGFEVSDLARVLNGTASAQSTSFESIDVNSPEFFSTAESANATDNDGVPEAVDLERYLRRDSDENSIDRVVPYRLDEATAVDPADGSHTSSRAEARLSISDPFARKQQEEDTGVIDPAGRRQPRAANVAPKPAAGYPLSDYLGGHLLMAPSQIAWPDAEPLILDPKNRVYLIHGGLKSAEPYVAANLNTMDFDRLTTRELERWRSLCTARPYLELQWLIALRNGDGWLPQHLDPGGSYRLRDRLNLDAHYAAQSRVEQVLQQWRRLHEVAVEAAVEMQSVFDTVAAFDAIGWIQWRPRERRK